MERYGENQDVIEMGKVGISGTWEAPFKKERKKKQCFYTMFLSRERTYLKYLIFQQNHELHE